MYYVVGGNLIVLINFFADVCILISVIDACRCSWWLRELHLCSCLLSPFIYNLVSILLLVMLALLTTLLYEISQRT